jgi:hypothetical protein
LEFFSRLSPSPHPEIPPSLSFQSSLNSIDENKTIENSYNFAFEAKKRCSDAFLTALPEKRLSDPNPAIRFSFVNRLFDMSDGVQLLSPPPKDFRKFSLPLSMSSDPASSLTSPPWRSFNRASGKRTTRQRDTALKFQWSVSDDAGKEVKPRWSNPPSPIEDFLDEQCLHFEENFVRLDDIEAKLLNDFDLFNEKFDKKSQTSTDERSIKWQASSESGISNDFICRKCGHNILKL